MLTEQQLDELFAFEVSQTWRRFSSRLLSDVRRIQSSGLAEILQSVFAGGEMENDSAVDTETAYLRASEFLARQGTQLTGNRQSFRRRYAEDPRLRSVVSEINQIEREIALAERPRRELQTLVERFVSENKRIHFTDRDIRVEVGNGETIELTALSSGEKQLIRMLVAAVSADRSTVIIDEPELSLHIDWQHELLGALQTLNPEAQIVAATHSPEIMAKLRDEKIHRL